MDLQVQVDHLVDPPALNVDQRWCVGQVSMDLSMGALGIRIARELVNRELRIVGNIFFVSY